MSAFNAEHIAALRQELLRWQGYRPLTGACAEPALGPLNNAFPNGVFATGAVHEFIAARAEDIAATSGFIIGLLHVLLKKDNPSLWISAEGNIYPPALAALGIPVHQLLFANLRREKEVLWTLEEALKCAPLNAVVAEVRQLDFTASRRLQLAVESSGVTALIIRPQPRVLDSTSIARWQIRSLPGLIEDDLPGVGFPRWKVELLRVRNGKPGSWEVTWRDGQLAFKEETVPAKKIIPMRKTG